MTPGHPKIITLPCGCKVYEDCSTHRCGRQPDQAANDDHRQQAADALKKGPQPHV